MNLEQTYADLWKASAYEEGHRSKMPKKEAAQPRTESQLRLDIIDALSKGELRMSALRAIVGAKATTVQNNLYTLRAAGRVHSVHSNPSVIWRIGPKPREKQ